MPERICKSGRTTAPAHSTVLSSLLLFSATAMAQPAELITRPTDPDFFEGVGNDNSGGLDNCRFGAAGNQLIFSSSAFNLVSDDRNAVLDVFVHDLATATLERVSLGSNGEEADDISQRASLSGDGRYVIFESQASNLGGKGASQGYRHDRVGGATVPIGFAPDGTAFNSVNTWDVSADGRLALFTADDQAWLRDVALGTTELISEGTDGSVADSFVTRPRMSDDGNRVVFYSSASNLVSGDTNGQRDVFIRERSSGVTTRITGAGGAEPDGSSQLARISSDGNWVAFESTATNLVGMDTEGQLDVFLHDVQAGVTTRISQDAFGTGGNARSRRAEISEDGRFVVFESDADNLVPGLIGNERRLFIYDREFDSLTRVAEDSSFPSAACITNSGNSGWVAYQATANPLIPAAITHQQMMLEPFDLSDPDQSTRGGVSTRVASRSTPALPVNIATGNSTDPAVSFSGNFLAFRTEAGNLLGTSPGGGQILRLNTTTGQLETASLGIDGEPTAAAFPAMQPSISATGERIAFRSRSDALVAGDTNNAEDVFVRDLALGQIVRASLSSDGNEASSDSTDPVISADGMAVVFRSSAGNLVPDDNNGQADLFVHELETGQTERVSVAADGSELPERSNTPDISGTGRFVVFSSRADLLNPGGPNLDEQVWLRDRQSGTTELISRRPDGLPGNDSSERPGISGDGRWVVFRSKATDLDPAFPLPPGTSVYLHDRQSGTTRLISIDAAGNAVPVDLNKRPRIAADGSTVVYQRQTDPDNGGNNRQSDRRFQGDHRRGVDPDGSLYLFSILDATSKIVTPLTIDGQPPNADLDPAAIGPGGRVLYLQTAATNLVRGMVTANDDLYRIDIDRLFGDGFEP